MSIKPSTLLKILGFIGIPVTAVLSAKAQVKAEKELEELKIQKGGSLETSEVVKIEAKAHVWTIVSGITTIVAHAGAYSMDAKTIAGLVALVGTGGYALNEYKDQLKKLIGTEKYNEIEKKIKETVSLDRLKKEPPKLTSPAPAVDSGRKLYYDELTKSWFTNTPDKIMEAVLDMEHQINKVGVYHASEWVTNLGIESPIEPVGDDDGWTAEYLYDEWANESDWIDVYFVDRNLDDGTPYTSIVIYQEPTNIEVYEEMGLPTAAIQEQGRMLNAAQNA